MAFDLNKVKQAFSAEKMKSLFPRKQTQTPAADASQAPAPAAAPAPAKQPVSKKKAAITANPWVAQWQQGVRDIKSVLQEGKFKLFAKQVVVLLLVFLGVRYMGGKLSAEKAELSDKISAISIQQTNQEDYLENKDRLLRLEPLFPDMAKKNDWLLRQIMDTFEAHQIKPNIDGNVVEKAGDTYTVVTQPVTFQQSYNELGQFLADIENGDPFLRISNMTITKLTDAASLGKNTVNLRFNTLFPKDKYAPRLFRDYTQQMKAILGEEDAAEEAANQADTAKQEEGPAPDEELL